MYNNKKEEEKAVIIGKASFIDFDAFASWCETEEADECFSVKNLWTDALYELQGVIPGVNVSQLHDAVSYHNERQRCYIEPLKKRYKYIEEFSDEDNRLSFSLLYEHEKFDIISFGNKDFLVPAGKLQKTYLHDYSKLSVSQIRQSISGNDSVSLELVPSDAVLSQVSIQEQKGNIENKRKQLEDISSEIEDVQNARKGELAELQAEIDRRVAILEAKKEEMLNHLNKKKAEMEEMKRKLEQELFVLESEIYSIRCFLGEVIDFIKLRSGAPAPADYPITLFQKMRFLDEELGKAVSFYDFDFDDYKVFEKLLKNRMDIVELFCPNEKCVSLVRVSKSGIAYGYASTQYGPMLTEYEVYHGKKIGILIRNGENLYFGWTDDEKISISEDMFFTPETKEVAANEAEKDSSTPIKEMVSRYFIFSILQGALENKKILSLPAEVKATFARPSEYIVYSAADGWIVDNRFGSFADIVEKTNNNIQVGNYVLSLQCLSDGHYNSWWGGRTCERDHNFSNRTRDVHLNDGEIYKINLVEEGSYGPEYYVSLVKNGFDYVYRNGEYTERVRDAYARFRVFTDEFIDLTYMNSVWLSYVITTRNLGYSAKNRLGSFAEVIRYLNKALKFVRQREEEEKALIEKFSPGLTNDENWPVKLSEWKLENNVRNITEYQAKRFVKSVE